MPFSTAQPIPIDGGNGTGKTTLIALLIEWYARLGQACFGVSTGEFYRIVAYLAFQYVQGNLQALRALPAETCIQLARDRNFQIVNGKGYLNGQEVERDLFRAPAISEATPFVSRKPEVRAFLDQAVIEMVAATSGLVFLDGRDIGTTVFPEAPVKFFLTVQPEESARRQGILLEQIKERDRRDANRDVAPMVPASDAHIIDTTNLTPNGLLEVVTTIIDTKLFSDSSLLAHH